MNQELSKRLEIDSSGSLLLVMEWDEEIYWNKITGINQIQELLFFEVV